ncbi:peptidoglycan bridge formation glycyltransferase FemA/FemB family protein [Ignavibacterium sp.]|uniref:lipid II:glycine glycyltransferase FemX n=1 Tax=Ignavibacterium sp. TaxID=2651167 RepID=UPI0021FF635B|nr:peptidoglycan bridge formation glycyltransferase FemA/FemB family protein [Ignavibacterium sp.]BDQ02794.1 MAG: hypothetical protein KatS3mg037_1369 [Ignavibacterium sp.]
MELTRESLSEELVKDIKPINNVRTDESYSFFNQFIIDDKVIKVYESKILIDDEWDKFVTGINDSCLHQLSGWADVKSSEGWDFIRFIYTQDNIIIGGYQILIKNFPFIGKIAYLNHAPVTQIQNYEFVKKLIEDFRIIIKKIGIRLAIISPPFNNNILVDELTTRFDRNIFFNVINAEAEMDLSADENTILKNMLRMRRQNISKRTTYNYHIFEGGEEHLETFFKLMSDTCQRNNVKPNPSSLAMVKKIWNYYHYKNLLNLYLFSINNEIVSAILAFEYQDRFIPWKFGWSGKYAKFKPNDIFHWELIRIAKQKGFKKYNLGGVNLSTAEKLSSLNKNLNEKELKSATFYKMGFGCYIRRLPDSVVHIPNPVLRALYKFYLSLNKSKLILKKKFRINLNAH